MKNIRNISWNQWVELTRRYSKYILIMVIFSLFTFYNVSVIPKDSPKKSQSSSDTSTDEIIWDITTEKPQITFTNVLQGRSADWYRMSVFTIANSATQIEAMLHSVFNETVPIGIFNVSASEDLQYHEILFQVPSGTFSDVRFMLRNEDPQETWSYAGVKLSELTLSRLNVGNRLEADRLTPTLVGGDILLSGARIEDFGKGKVFYSYSPKGEVNDSFDLFDTKGGVRFDTKKKIITGECKRGTAFTYRFFTVDPYKTFKLAARQAGDTEKEVKLEYSFDNSFWKEVSFTQEDNEPQIFSLALTGTGDQNMVYIRVSYNGENKKMGSYGLNQLLVRAELIRK